MVRLTLSRYAPSLRSLVALPRCAPSLRSLVALPRYAPSLRSLIALPSYGPLLRSLVTIHLPEIIIHVQHVGKQAFGRTLLQIQLFHFILHHDSLPSDFLTGPTHS